MDFCAPAPMDSVSLDIITSTAPVEKMGTILRTIGLQAAHGELVLYSKLLYKPEAQISFIYRTKCPVTVSLNAKD